MTSYRGYRESGEYRGRAAGIFGRSGPSEASLPTYRSYGAIVGEVNRPLSKERHSFQKKERNEEKPTFVYSRTKDREHDRTKCNENKGIKSRLSTSRSSLLDKYPSPGGSFPSDVSSSSCSGPIRDRYNRGSSRENTSFTSVAYPSTTLTRTYVCDSRLEKKDPALAYRGLRTTSGRKSSSREPSPEVGSFRGFSKAPTIYSRSTGANGSSDGNGVSATLKYGLSSSSPSRFLPSRGSKSERLSLVAGYSVSGRYREPAVLNASKCPEEKENEKKIQRENEKPSKKEVQGLVGKANREEEKEKMKEKEDEIIENELENERANSRFGERGSERIKLVTRSTSPSPPLCPLTYIRKKRLDVPMAQHKEVVRVRRRTDMKDREIQTDCLDDNRRFLRYAANTGRIPGSSWSSYLEKFSSGNSSMYGRSFSVTSSNPPRIGALGYLKSNERVDTTPDRNDMSMTQMTPNANETFSESVPSGLQSDMNLHGDVIPNAEFCKPIDADKRPEKGRSVIHGLVKGNTISKSTTWESIPAIPQESSYKEGKSQGTRGTKGTKGTATSESERGVREPRRNDSSSTESSPGKVDAHCSRKACTPRSDVSSSSRAEETGRWTGREIPQRRDRFSPRKDSIQSTPVENGSTTSLHPRCDTTKSISSQGGSMGCLPTSNEKCKSRSKSRTNAKSSFVSLSSLSSNSLTSRGVRIKGTVPSAGGSASQDTRRHKPPMPRNETTNQPATSVKYVNKDFRKSALNMEDGGDASRSKCYDRRKICERSSSVSSQDSQSGGRQDPPETSRSSSPTPRLQANNVSGSLSPGSGVVIEISSHIRSPSTFSSPDEDEDEEEEQSSSMSRHWQSTTGSSRITADGEVSMTANKPLCTSSSESCSNNDRCGRTEEAKSFLIRALAPVTSLFKVTQDAIGENSVKTKNGHSSSITKSVMQDSSKSLSFDSNSVAKDVDKRPVDSVQINRESTDQYSWLLNPNDNNMPEGVDERASACSDDISQDTTISIALSDDGNFKSKNQDGEPEERMFRCFGPNQPSDEDEATNGRKCTVRHQESGERPWWLSDDPNNVPEGIEVISVLPTAAEQNIDSKDTVNKGEAYSPGINKLRNIDSGEQPWWMDNSASVPEGVLKISSEASNSNTNSSSESFEKIDIGHDLGPLTVDVSTSFSNCPPPPPPPPPLPFSQQTLFLVPTSTSMQAYSEPLGERASPEGVENPLSIVHTCKAEECPFENVQLSFRRPPRRKRPSDLPLFIGEHTDIDNFLGGTVMCRSPIALQVCDQESLKEDSTGFSSRCEEIDATRVIIHDSTAQTPLIQRRLRDNGRPQPDGYIPLDDTALQLYKDGDYGAYLDLEASISEQQEEFEGFQTNRKNSIVLRTQLSVRVHSIIEKLLNSEGRELRRALFSLKQIFQEDKDLVHEFVQNDGLACLIKVGSEADQNYQNYILRALGQVMLYVDGMNGVMEHGQTVQWLYTLIASRFRLVVKTALKLLLVFVEYVETNSLLLVRAVRSVDTSRGMIPWTNVMKLLKDYDAADTELLIYATTLVNKCLNGIPDQDTYYDQVDCLEEQGIEGIIQRYMSKQGTDLDLLRQFQIYEAVLHHEDGNERDSPIRQLDDNIRKTLRNRKSLVDSHERRKSRRHSTGTSPLSMSLSSCVSPRLNHSLGLKPFNNALNSRLSHDTHVADDDLDDDEDDDDDDEDEESSSSQSSQGHLGDVQLNGGYKENKVDVGVTPALRRRRERAERQRSFIREQQEVTASMRASVGHVDDQENPFSANGIRYANGLAYAERKSEAGSNKIPRPSSRKDLTPLMNAANKLDSEVKKPWYGRSPDEGVECDEENHTDDDGDRRVVLQLKREGTVKDLTQKLAAQNLIPSSPVEDKVSRMGDMSGLISKAKEGLAKSKSKADVLKSPTGENLPKLQEIKKSENELHWEELAKQLKRPLALCDLDFTDLNSDDEIDVLGPVNVTNGIPPPPPPPMGSSQQAPTASKLLPPPPLPPLPPLPQGPTSFFSVNLKPAKTATSTAVACENKSSQSTASLAKKNKKTVKLFWKEVRDDPIILSRLDKNKMIWDELSPVVVDTQKLEHLFESRAKDLINKKQQEMNKNKEIIVLDHKRSNAINIGMTKLPPPRSIKTAILKMDATIMNREGIEKLLTMLPTEEERSRIQEAQAANPDLPLGSAEQFLLTLASISELPARLKLWAFKLDFENSEKEIADPLMDLKQGMETLRMNKTFRGILSTLLSIGIFLNGNEVKGFQLEYLAKVPEVKDTVHKHSLLHHLCHMVMEKFPESTDLYSEIGAVTRASKIDFDELASNIGKLESECKASWDHLKLIAKHDGSTMMKVKMSDFLADCAERIIVLGIVHRRIINRFHKFVLWLGIPLHRVQDTKPNEFCRIVSEFALEYRTTRERVIQQLEKKANHRERNKTRGKMITEVGKFKTKEDRADAELRQLLGSDISDVESIHGTLPWRRQRKDGRASLGPLLRDESINGNLTDGDDELLESLVKTATKTPGTRTTPRERKRTRHADRKSLRRTLKNGLSEEEKKHIAAYIKGY